ncbi:hypothetical protein B0H13DRAFT_1883950 [Mycena leptocephala]|nr:hypothetical protein B0H13DRAFT_1883950 [Mycena leptocephala]
MPLATQPPNFNPDIILLRSVRLGLVLDFGVRHIRASECTGPGLGWVGFGECSEAGPEYNYNYSFIRARGRRTPMGPASAFGGFRDVGFAIDSFGRKIGSGRGAEWCTASRWTMVCGLFNIRRSRPQETQGTQDVSQCKRADAGGKQGFGNSVPVIPDSNLEVQRQRRAIEHRTQKYKECRRRDSSKGTKIDEKFGRESRIFHNPRT